MSTISSYEAKTHMPRLLREVERGETVIITRHGKPVAKLGPIGEPAGGGTAKTIERMQAIRSRSATLSVDEILDSIHEGHKY